MPPLTPTLSRREREFEQGSLKAGVFEYRKAGSLYRRERVGVRGGMTRRVIQATQGG
ncbi:MAG: hypothetical protein JWO08_3175 [Verrucomicrobiaceae bacterium]|nr:hypothetical protein [Verrucomicrobiaceae bacterium]